MMRSNESSGRPDLDRSERSAPLARDRPRARSPRLDRSRGARSASRRARDRVPSPSDEHDLAWPPGADLERAPGSRRTGRGRRPIGRESCAARAPPGCASERLRPMNSRRSPVAEANGSLEREERDASRRTPGSRGCARASRAQRRVVLGDDVEVLAAARRTERPLGVGEDADAARTRSVWFVSAETARA